MKNLLLVITLICFVFGCSTSGTNVTEEENKKDTTLAFYGDTITIDGAKEAVTVTTEISGKDSVPLKLSGIINSVCQKKGCWMEMEIGEGKTMRVTFKDYAFFVPKDAGGKTAIIEGYAYSDTTTVAELKHYAEDEGKTKDEIEKIIQPEVEISFEAHGVIIKK